MKQRETNGKIKSINGRGNEGKGERDERSEKEENNACLKNT